MSTKIFLLFLNLAAVCFLTACGNCSKKVDCPGYNDTVLNNLFPYADNQQLIFRSNTNETVLFTLKNTKTTQPYQATTGSLFTTPVCEAEKSFRICRNRHRRTKAFCAYA